MTREEFRANLYQTYIASGVQDHVLIQEYISIAELFVFQQISFTIDDRVLLQKKYTKA